MKHNFLCLKTIRINYPCSLCSNGGNGNTGRLLRFSSASAGEILPPKRIQRGPTDILKAIASTVKRDPTAAHYKYHDDPYLIPMSNLAKRMYALSQESGRKAAMWIKQEHPQLFMHREAEPPIEAFFPRATYDETDEVNNEILSTVIKEAFLSDAITVYELMGAKEIEVTKENKQALLELLCFFNDKEDISPDLVEERWFSQASRQRGFLKKTWKDGGYAEKVFSELEPSPESYSAIIQGMTKYYQVNKAFDYYTDAQEKGFVLSVDAFNSLIRVVTFVREGFLQRWGHIQDLLKKMNEQKIRPNLGTLNAILEVLSQCTSAKEARKLALQTVSEFAQFGIHPCLASYRHLLLIFTNERAGPVPDILAEILDNLEGSELKIQDKGDMNFFVTAMEKCRYTFGDTDLAYRLDDLLHKGENYNFIGDSYRESVYYRHFFMVLCQSDLLENVMKRYELLVPNVYIPENSVMEEIIKLVTMNGATEYFERLWEDMVWFEMADKEKTLSILLSGLVLNRVPWSHNTTSVVALKFGNIAWSMFEKVEGINKLYPGRIAWTGEMLGDILLLCLCADNVEHATAVFNKLKNSQADIVGVPKSESLSLFVDVFLAKSDIVTSLACLDYMNEAGYGEVDDIARKIASTGKLTNNQCTKIAATIGTHVFQPVQPPKEDNDQKVAAQA